MSSTIRLGLRILCFFLGLYALFFLTSFALDDTEHYVRHTLHDLYATEDVDVAFVGASHVYRGVDPVQFDAETGLVSVNLGTSAQYLHDSLYMVEEALRVQNLDTLVFELRYPVFSLPFRGSTTSTRIIYDYMRPSLVKSAYANAVLDHPMVLDPLYHIMYNQAEIQQGMAEGIPLLKLRSPGYWDYSYRPIRDTGDHYVAKGFVSSPQVMDNSPNPNSRAQTFGTADHFEDRLDYIRKVIALCRARDVEVIFFAIPIHPSILVHAGNYQEIYDFFTDFAAQYGSAYYDFNMVKDQYLPHENALFKDAKHLNGYGAEKFTHLLAQVLTAHRNGEDTARYFHQEFAGRAAEYQGLLAVDLQAKHKGGLLQAEAEAVYTNAADVEYAFAVMRGKTTLYARDYAPSPTWAVEVALPGDAPCRLHVYVREKGSGEDYDVRRSMEL